MDYLFRLASVADSEDAQGFHGVADILTDLLIRCAARANPNSHLQGLVDKYRRTRGINRPEYGLADDLDMERAKKIADAYEAMRHTPDDPKVRVSYDALIEQLVEQYRFLKENGYSFTPHRGKDEPYPSSREMLRDLKERRHLSFLPTQTAFGEGDSEEDSPLLARTPFEENGHKMLANDLFRSVHDVLGHGPDGVQFGPLGEENAWRAHSGLFTNDAQGALTTETRGQNSWVNFGRHIRRPDGTIPQRGEPGYLPPQDRPFAEQKTGLLPKKFWNPDDV
jgi:hypothetical protein